MSDPAEITAEEIADIRQLCEAATPGPWQTEPDCAEPVCVVSEFRREGGRRIANWIATCDLQEDDAPDADLANARFIAASRTALPRLLDALESARERIKELEKEKNDA